MFYSTSILSALAISNYAQAARLLGRVNPSTSELTWPSTGVSFSFSGTSASIGITHWGENSIDLSVDGGNWIVMSNVTGDSITTPLVTPGNHTVVLRKRSEAAQGSVYVGKVVANGTLGPDVVPPKRQIEIIGDSITVGYGLDGVLPCTNTAALEDNPKTYAALAADALGADYSVVAWSGKGLTRNYWGGVADDAVLMPELYSRYGANDADNSYTFPNSWNPSAIVINLGTNDFSYVSTPPRTPLNATVFTNAMVTFVQSIQKHYPNAWYFLMTSPMLSDGYPTAEDAQKTTQTSALKTVIMQLNSTKIQLVDWPTQGSDVGCDYHPNAATHAAEGVVLAAAIKATLQW
ncbi:carbohydrate esterase family 2 protein [Stipitochalara longipes BDJ]|nr:carbohydrate esterase family 2 protein [Stipitochalara longipes BDJ]